MSHEDQQRELERLLPARRGHFRLESGHHGDLWLDLELLFLRPAEIQPLAEELARKLSKYAVEAVCGPLVEGAFVAAMVAPVLGVPFSYTEGKVASGADRLFPVKLAREAGIVLETLASLPNEIWTPSECPLCARRIPLTGSRE